MNTATLEPNILGFWTRCIRETSNWSQEALAAMSGLDVRTIQRVESGKSVSISTRRSLARGLGYENPDTFDEPDFIMNVQKILEGVQTAKKEDFEKQFPDRVRLKTARVINGETLGRLADSSNATLLHIDDDILQEAKQVAASLFDYIRDLVDVSDDVSFSDKVGFNQDLESLLRQLESLGAAVYSASRATKIVGENWADKHPISTTIGYLIVVLAEKHIEEMIVPRRLS
jgi:transcriptional regulator with XRE-family HTH domain